MDLIHPDRTRAEAREKNVRRFRARQRRNKFADFVQRRPPVDLAGFGGALSIGFFQNTKTSPENDDRFAR